MSRVGTSGDDPRPRIATVHGALPPHRYPQGEITEMLAGMGGFDDSRPGLLRRLHAGAGVRSRHLVLPLERYAGIDGFGAANDAYLRGAVELGAEAVDGALRAAGLAPTDVDLLLFTSVTGIGAPSVDARLVGRLGMRPDVKRLPVFGLGCVAGAAGLARLHDYLLAWPDHVGVLLSVELCSLTLQRHDGSAANAVASALFGDGAAAVAALGGRRAEHVRLAEPGPRIVATRSQLYPDTESAMGWQVTDRGLKVVLAASVSDLVRANVADDVRDFLADHGLKIADIASWVCHPGGPKVLDAVSQALSLPEDALELSWQSLAEVGNLSSASVLHVLRDTIARRRRPSGEPGLLMAIGPGMCCEFVLFRW